MIDIRDHGGIYSEGSGKGNNFGGIGDYQTMFEPLIVKKPNFIQLSEKRKEIMIKEKGIYPVTIHLLPKSTKEGVRELKNSVFRRGFFGNNFILTTGGPYEMTMKGLKPLEVEGINLKEVDEEGPLSLKVIFSEMTDDMKYLIGSEKGKMIVFKKEGTGYKRLKTNFSEEYHPSEYDDMALIYSDNNVIYLKGDYQDSILKLEIEGGDAEVKKIEISNFQLIIEDVERTGNIIFVHRSGLSTVYDTKTNKKVIEDKNVFEFTKDGYEIDEIIQKGILSVGEEGFCVVEAEMNGEKVDVLFYYDGNKFKFLTEELELGGRKDFPKDYSSDEVAPYILHKEYPNTTFSQKSSQGLLLTKEGKRKNFILKANSSDVKLSLSVQQDNTYGLHFMFNDELMGFAHRILMEEGTITVYYFSTSNSEKSNGSVQYLTFEKEDIGFSIGNTYSYSSSFTAVKPMFRLSKVNGNEILERVL